MYLLTNISNMFLAQCWGLETCSRPFYDFNKTAIPVGKTASSVNF